MHEGSDCGGDIGIYTPAQLSVMLTGIEAKLIPFVALGGLAGLRTSEIHRLDRADIDLHGGHIVIGKQKSKTGQRRIVAILPALRAWIETIVSKSGPVVPQYSGDAPLLRAFRQALEPLKLDSFTTDSDTASRLTGSPRCNPPTKLRSKWGNSPRKLFQNYHELATKTQAEKWFSVMPATSEKVVFIAGAA